MIALLDSLPLLRQDDNECSPVRKDWLRFCLCRAAEKAGYASWWLADHVASSVICYLATEYDSNVVTPAQIGDIIRSVLQAIGYAEVALCFELLNPPFEISLTELAKEAGPGYELAFFQLLKKRMEPALSEQTVEIHGLRSCVRHLQSVKTWSRTCSQLRNEIVRFVRGQVEGSSKNIVLTIR